MGATGGFLTGCTVSKRKVAEERKAPLNDVAGFLGNHDGDFSDRNIGPDFALSR
jgi:hypothetical protein